MYKKYLKLEFKDGTTFDEIKEELIYYKRKGIIAMTNINGYDIFNDSSDLEADFFKAINKISEEQFQEITKLKKQKEEKERLVSKWHIIELDELYKYYIGLSELFVVSEKKEKFKKFMIVMYETPTKYSLARLISSLLLIFEEEDRNSRYLQLNGLFSSIQTDDDRTDLSIALGIVKDYGKKGNKVDEIMFFDQIHAFTEKEMKKIKTLENQIDKLTNK